MSRDDRLPFIVPTDSPTSGKRSFTDAEAAELVRTVRARRSWPRPPTAAFWLRIAADVCLVASLLCITLIRAAITMPQTIDWALPASLFASWFILRFAAGRICLRLRRRVIEQGGVACINCHYPLSSLESAPNTESFCPECREPYRVEEVRREWSTWQPGVFFY